MSAVLPLPDSAATCRGVRRPVALESWRSYYYCPACGKRLHAGEDGTEALPHPDPRYTYVVIPAHVPRRA